MEKTQTEKDFLFRMASLGDNVLRDPRNMDVHTLHTAQCTLCTAHCTAHCTHHGDRVVKYQIMLADCWDSQPAKLSSTRREVCIVQGVKYVSYNCALCIVQGVRYDLYKVCSVYYTGCAV